MDCGDGISKALLAQKIKYNSINGILISHLHPDHFSGLGGLIIQMIISKRTNKLEVFVHASLIKTVKEFIYSSYIFEEKIDFELSYIPFAHDRNYSVTDKIKFISRQNTHLEPYKIYDKSDRLSFTCSSFLFKLNGVNIHYSGDIGKAEDLMLFSESKIHTLISETSHVDIPKLIKAAEMLKIKRLIFTHISDEDESFLLNLAKAKNANNSFEIIVAYDGLITSI